MSMSVGASSNALSYLQSLLAQGTSGVGDAASASNPLAALLQTMSGIATDPSTTEAPPSGAPPTSGASFDPGTMAALLSLQGQSASSLTAQSPSSLFSKLDTDGDGQISQSEFEVALGADGVDTSSADALFSKLDTNGDGSISQSELSQAKHGHHHHHHGGGESQAGGSSGQNAVNSLLSAVGADGATTQTATNADGSSTTTITYADGSTVEMTTPTAAANGDGTAGAGTNGSNSANLLEQLIRLQSQLLGAATTTLSAIA